MKKITILTVLCSLFLMSCNSEPSLEKYFVANSENKNFLAADVSPSLLKLNSSKLTAEQSKAISTFKNMNILAFKRDSTNGADYDIERKKVNTLLKDVKYQELMRVGSGKDGASISFVGDEKHIQEFVVYANKKEIGFAVVRILGKDMDPTAVMSMISALQHSEMDLKQLEPLRQFFPKNEDIK